MYVPLLQLLECYQAGIAPKLTPTQDRICTRLQFHNDSQLLYPGRVVLSDGGQEVCPGAREGSGC